MIGRIFLSIHAPRKRMGENLCAKLCAPYHDNTFDDSTHGLATNEHYKCKYTSGNEEILSLTNVHQP